MNNYYCKNCNNLLGKWDNKYKYYEIFCNYIRSKKFKSIYFLDCKNCNKFVGLLCMHVCINCFGEDEIFGEENLFNFFLKYKKIKPLYLCLNNNYVCIICNTDNFRVQYWFFEELIFITYNIN